MLIIKKNVGVAMIATTFLLFPLTGNSAHPVSRTVLYTPPMLSNGGIINCPVLNITSQPLNVTTTFFDNTGNIVSTSGEQTLSPGGTGGLSSSLQDGYCQWIVNGSGGSVRAVGMSIGPAGTAIYPAD